MQIQLQPTSKEFWESKYQLKDDSGTPVDKDIDDTYKRVARALAAVETNPDEWYQKFLKVLQNGAVPAGRILSNAGAEAYKPKVSLINCLAGDTPVVTRHGIKSIKELSGKDVEILNGNGEWTTAPFKSFGEQETHKITLKWGNNRKTKTEIHATKDHRWFLSDGRVVTTEFWLTGGLNNKTRTIPHLFVPKENFVRGEWEQGFIHGLVYGDGSKVVTENTFNINLCSEKQELTDMVADILQTTYSVYEDVATTRFALKNEINLKEVPSAYTYSYLRGFLAGIIATDGSVHPNGKGCEVSLYGDKKLVDFVLANSIYCGVMPTYSRKSAGRGEVTNYGKRNKDLWVVGLHPATIDSGDIVRSRHKNNFIVTKDGKKAVNQWFVVAVDRKPIKQEVFCCHEYDTTAFAIANGMKTGQCTVSETIKDSMIGIMGSCTKSAITLASGAGIGYEFSTLRPKGAYVSGAGAFTSGPLPFMSIFDTMCDTVSSAGGRRGAQMGTFSVWHPDVEDFITAKRKNGFLRKFNLSLLIDDEFMEAVKSNADWKLVFPVMKKENRDSIETVWKDLFWDQSYCEEQGYTLKDGKILCRVYKTVKAADLWDVIMQSTYNFAEPGFLLIDKINEYNNNYFCERIRSTNPCGEQPLPPNGSCLLGSINLTNFVIKPFTSEVYFDFDTFEETVRIFTRMLDNVVEINGLPLEEQRHELTTKRRHGMGFTGLGSALSMMNVRYGGEGSLYLTYSIMKSMAVTGFKEGVNLAKEKGCAPILESQENRQKWVDGEYMKRIWAAWPDGVAKVLEYGCRFTHHTSIAPTGTISLTLGNNCSNGIEPTFSHKYTRNVIKAGKKTKDAVDVYSYEMLLYKHLTGNDTVPKTFSTSDTVTTKEHVDIQAAAQYWCDSSISKTINVATDMPYEDFKNVYIYAYDKGLKGCTTFRFNPAAFQGVLVKDEDLKNTKYVFHLEDGTSVEASGDTTIEYDGESHKAANLYDAIKEGQYGRF